jgi:hypothetical protein
LLQTCRERRNAKDDDFFDVVFWYAATAIFEHDEREASFREMIGRQRGRLSGPARRAKNSARLDRAAAALNELRKGNEIRRFRKAEIAEKAKLNPGALQHTSTKKIAARARELRNALLKR